MLKDFVVKKTLAHFPFEPTDEQLQLVEQLATFMTDRENNGLFLLKGYAGTGKTSIISALIKLHDELKQPVVLMAPTGRAAKVLSRHAEKSAFTIHRKIYRQKNIANSSFQLDFNPHKHTLFIVDEASMINNNQEESSFFGNGCLLDDLLQYVYTGEGCRLLLIGDEAQLPPVMKDFSPALDKKQLESYGYEVSEFQLTEVLRQSKESGILDNATRLRNALRKGEIKAHPKFHLSGFADIESINGETLIEKIEDAYRINGVENTMIITRSNKRADIYNQGIRNRILQKEEELSSGDLLMVVKNNYFYGKEYPAVSFIANGDIVEVRRIRRYHELYGFRFADLTLYLSDYDTEIEARILVESLYSDSPAALKLLNEQLFNTVAEDYADIGNKRKRMKSILENEFYNALQLKFAYAVTCHKAQGGEWDTIFIDHGGVPNEQSVSIDYYRWLYTALTRASHKTYLVNFPPDFFNAKK